MVDFDWFVSLSILMAATVFNSFMLIEASYSLFQILHRKCRLKTDESAFRRHFD